MDALGSVLSGLGSVGMALGQNGNKFSRKSMWSQIEGQKHYQEWLSEFNSPKNQIKRFIEAGINPNAIVGGVSSGNMSSGFSPSVPVDGDGPISRLGSAFAGLGDVIGRREAKQMAKDDIARQDELRDLEVESKRLQLNILQKNLENWDLTIQAKKAGMQAPVVGEPVNSSTGSSSPFPFGVIWHNLNMRYNPVYRFLDQLQNGDFTNALETGVKTWKSTKYKYR